MRREMRLEMREMRKRARLVMIIVVVRNMKIMGIWRYINI